MNRCYIEDFIETNVGEHVIILFEKSEQNPFPESHDFICKTKPHLEYGYRKKLTYIRGIVSSSPNRQLAITGMFLSDLQSGFHNQNYGSYIKIMVSEDKFVSILVTWNMVVKSRIQIWKKINLLRDPFNIFCNIRRNKPALRTLLAKIYPEVSGDRVQSMILLSAYYRALIQQPEVSIDDKITNDELVKAIRQELFEREELNHFIMEVDRVFKAAMEKCYCNFTAIAEPLVSESEIKKLIEMYKCRLPNHYEVMAELYNYSRRMGEMRNIHLLHTGFYDRKIFFEFLSQLRVGNNQNLIHWAIC